MNFFFKPYTFQEKKTNMSFVSRTWATTVEKSILISKYINLSKDKILADTDPGFSSQLFAMGSRRFFLIPTQNLPFWRSAEKCFRHSVEFLRAQVASG